MAHIHEEIFYGWLLEDGVPSVGERTHLDGCATCQQQFAAIQHLVQTLQVARASEPSAAALARYADLYAQVEQAPSLPQRIADFITAQLQWDGRRQPAWQGVRNTQAASYRLLYATEQVEIEMLIAPREGRFQIEGEVVPLAEPTPLLPAQCELQNLAGTATIGSSDCQANGRFHLKDVPTGSYRLSFVAATGPTIVIEQLELLQR